MVIAKVCQFNVSTSTTPGVVFTTLPYMIKNGQQGIQVLNYSDIYTLGRHVECHPVLPS